MSATIFKFVKPRALSKKSICLRSVSTSEFKLKEDDAEEIKIPVPWGHIAGKWWGSKNQRPVLCLHGWQDNANSFNTLIPELSPKLSYFAIDLPGHGHSSHLPRGVFYKTIEPVDVIRRIQLHFDWTNVSLMGHSFGAACSFLFSAFFPKSVDFFIGIDLLKPYSEDYEKEIKRASKKINKMFLNDSLDLSKAPFYKREELIERWIKATDNSLNEKSCRILLERGAREKDGRFQLTRDVKLKSGFTINFSQNELIKMAEAITCNVLFIKAKNVPHFEDEKNVFETVKVMEKNSKYFEMHELPGTHHIHLNSPQVVSPVINSFIANVSNQQ